MHVLLLMMLVLVQDPLALDLERAIKGLYSDRHTESHLAREELILIGRRAVPELVKELAGQPMAVPLKADATKKTRVRRMLCEILGDIRDNSEAGVKVLSDRLTDKEEYGTTVAAAAAYALGRIADVQAAGKLAEALKAAGNDNWLKYYCIHALGVLRDASQSEVLKKALEDSGAAELGDDKVHLIAAAVADALGRMRAKDAVDGLGKLLTNDQIEPTSQQKVGIHAARALERILGESKGALEGDATAVSTSLENWKKWWNAEQNKRNVGITIERIKQVAEAIEAFKKDQGKYPKTLIYLREKQADHSGPWPEGGYYKGEGYDGRAIKDAWGWPIEYSEGGKNGAPFDVISRGANKIPWGGGLNADLWNHSQWKAIRLEATHKAMNEIVEAIKKFKADHNVEPENLYWLTGDRAPAGFTAGKEWPKEGYLKLVPKDGFDGDFQYKKGGTGGEPYDLISHGADFAPGGVDEFADVWSHDKWKAAGVEATKKKGDEIAKALELFKKEQERYPKELEHLKEKPPYVKKWGEKPYHNDPVNDGFGNPFVYRETDKGFELVSLGSDGKEGGTGTDEDVKWPQP